MCKNRLLLLDLLRIIACFLIVLMHSPMPTVAENSFFVTAISFFTEPAIGLFFIVSGALLLPVKSSSFSFLTKRFIRIGVPLIIWTIFFIFLKIYNSESEINILSSIFSFPFSNQGHGVFWFLYTILGLYLLSPIISSWLKNASKRELEFYLLIWGITLCYTILESFITTNESTTGILYYFSGYAGYYILGYYLKNYSGNLLLAISSFFSLAGVGVIIYLKYFNILFDFYRLFWYLSIFIASWSVVYWYVAIYIFRIIAHHHLYTWLPRISNLTFGVYLIHIFIMREWLWKTNFILSIPNYYLQTLTISLISFFLSLAIVFIISKIPYLKLLVGFRLKAN